MLISTFDQFVQDSDQSAGKPPDERVDIAIYGLAAEIGSVVAAVKKRFLAEGGQESWNIANDEIVEELGDVVWYCFALARLANKSKPVNIFAHDIANLKREIGGADERAKRIRRVLDATKIEEFLQAAESFPKHTRGMEFEDYQSIAILTARTTDRTLVEVCLAALWQLSAQLFRRKLPAIELELNRDLEDRPINDVLGGIAWHVSALASIYGLKLSDIAQRNITKVSYRLDRKHPTPLHDTDYPLGEQFPRSFEIAFVTVDKGRSRMYLNGRRLGNELTDNSRDDDGYRFHDVMHLANATKLSWSPVLRGLMGRKRKSNPETDEVEDGARAQIVEEAVIKAIHSEGTRLAALQGRTSSDTSVHLFSNHTEITFRFLKFIHNLVGDLEVEKNRYWEWEEAIVEGHKVFHQLRCEGQGTVTVDLVGRSISFRPAVCIPLSGKVVGLGSAYVQTNDTPNAKGQLRELAQKRAILDALGFPEATDDDLMQLSVTEVAGCGISVKTAGRVRQAAWERKVVTFQTSVRDAQGNAIYCTALALADD